MEIEIWQTFVKESLGRCSTGAPAFFEDPSDTFQKQTPFRYIFNPIALGGSEQLLIPNSTSRLNFHVQNFPIATFIIIKDLTNQHLAI